MCCCVMWCVRVVYVLPFVSVFIMVPVGFVCVLLCLFSGFVLPFVCAFVLCASCVVCSVRLRCVLCVVVFCFLCACNVLLLAFSRLKDVWMFCVLCVRALCWVCCCVMCCVGLCSVIFAVFFGFERLFVCMFHVLLSLVCYLWLSCYHCLCVLFSARVDCCAICFACFFFGGGVRVAVCACVCLLFRMFFVVGCVCALLLFCVFGCCVGFVVYHLFCFGLVRLWLSCQRWLFFFVCDVDFVCMILCLLSLLSCFLHCFVVVCCACCC